MEEYIIERKDLRGNAATSLGDVFFHPLTFSGLDTLQSLFERISTFNKVVCDFACTKFEVLEDSLMANVEEDSSVTLNQQECQIHVITSEPFEIKLWGQISSLLTNGKKQKALYTLYDRLIEQLESPHKCDNFIIHVMKYDLSSDVIVHILNALSPIKNKLEAWESFVNFSTAELEKKVGPEKTSRLLNVIV